VKINSNGRIVFLALVVALLITACARTTEEPLPTIETVNTGEIAAVVLSEVRDELANLAPTSESEQAEVDMDAIVETVTARVEERLTQQVDTLSVAFGNEMAATAVAEADGEGLEASLIDLYRLANPSVVFIIVPPVGSGSGFVFNDEGYIVTNNHVVVDGSSYEIVFANGERRSAELVGQDVDSDLAVLQVEELPAGVKALARSSSADLRVGQFVAAIGNPFGRQGSMSVGIISGLDRSISSQRDTVTRSNYSLPEVIQTDAPINPGNSGGPLLNLAGELVGVNSSIATTTGINSGVGFAIPVDAVSRIVPSLIETGSFEYSYMGAAFDDEISLEDLDVYGLSQTQGAYVLGVTDGGPAAAAGLRPADETTGRGGDLIVSIDSVPIDNFGDLNSYLVFNTTVGQTIEITVLRGGEQVNIPLTLGERP
jgi:2-alkenal reductase